MMGVTPADHCRVCGEPADRTLGTDCYCTDHAEAVLAVIRLRIAEREAENEARQ
jgi:predicted nucleic acid-binding Zn ribbon protein